jgi:hypothetical protein
MLFAPQHHEPLSDRPWDVGMVRDAIADIVADTVAAYDADRFWPSTASDLGRLTPPLMEVYTGAAGIVWALSRLGASFDAAAVAARVHERYLAAPTKFDEAGYPAEWRSSLLGGETGIAFVAYALAPTPERDSRLQELAIANLQNRANELMWGVPGTLLVARAMNARAGGEWATLVREIEGCVRSSRNPDGWWTQHMHGHDFVALGPVHGFVGNVRALGDGTADDARLLRDSAERSEGHANWPPTFGEKKRLLQWCHGAPGILTTAAAYLDDDLVTSCADLIWHAGPLQTTAKGAGICHGTAGNGYGLLAAFTRTRDERWLERARRFAVHALAQTRALPPRYALFNGSIGVALFATDCLRAVLRYPVLDDWLDGSAGTSARCDSMRA